MNQRRTRIVVCSRSRTERCISAPRSKGGFSILELLVCIGVIALLLALLIPGLSATREHARQTMCMSNQKQLVLAWTMYAQHHLERVMPLAGSAPVGPGGENVLVYWWGTHGTGTEGVVHDDGFIAPFIDMPLNGRSVYECPSQPWGTYTPQGPAGTPTSTYGYNGYYLTPSRTPGWNSTIGFRPWRRLTDLRNPWDLMVFADAMLPYSPMRNTALLDPPELYHPMYGWIPNDSPTTAFRHGAKKKCEKGLGVAISARGDGAVRSNQGKPSWMVPRTCVGSVTRQNAPHYVPDAAEWPVNPF